MSIKNKHFHGYFKLHCYVYFDLERSKVLWRPTATHVLSKLSLRIYKQYLSISRGTRILALRVIWV